MYGMASCVTVGLVELICLILWKSNDTFRKPLELSSVKSCLFLLPCGILLGKLTIYFAFMYIVLLLNEVIKSDLQTKRDFVAGAIGVAIAVFIIINAGREAQGCICKDGTHIYGSHPKACVWHGGVDYWLYKYWWE